MSLRELEDWETSFRAARARRMDLIGARAALFADILTRPLGFENQSESKSEPWKNAPPVVSRHMSSSCPLSIGDDRRVGNGLELAFGEGWNEYESWGCWSCERHSWLLFQLRPATAAPLRLYISIEAYLPAGTTRRLKISSTHREIAHLQFDAINPIRTAALTITRDDLKDADYLELCFDFSGLASPADMGGEDIRVLGFSLNQVSAREETGSSRGLFERIVERKTFFTGGSELDYLLGKGWSYTEDWGIWAEHFEAEVGFVLAEHVSGNLEIEMEIQAYLPDDDTTQTLTLRCRDRLLTTFDFHTKQRIATIAVTVDEDLYADKRTLLMTLSATTLLSPATHENSRDLRNLSFGLRSLRVI